MLHMTYQHPLTQQASQVLLNYQVATYTFHPLVCFDCLVWFTPLQPRDGVEFHLHWGLLVAYIILISVPTMLILLWFLTYKVPLLVTCLQFGLFGGFHLQPQVYRISLRPILGAQACFEDTVARTPWVPTWWPLESPNDKIWSTSGMTSSWELWEAFSTLTVWEWCPSLIIHERNCAILSVYEASYLKDLTLA